MRQRCEKPSNAEYLNYGGRGIRVCERWQKFENFIADMGRRPSPDHTIDRLDVNGNYEPGNCAWVPMRDQFKNMRKNVHITIDGRTMILKDWAREFGISYTTVRGRIAQGWTPEDALRRPLYDNVIASSGRKGVYRHEGRTKPYQAKIKLPDGRYKSLGYYVDPDEAHTAFRKAEAELGAPNTRG